jgi:hypothetical protein
LSSALLCFCNHHLCSNSSGTNWSITFQILGFTESKTKYELAVWAVYTDAAICRVILRASSNGEVSLRYVAHCRPHTTAASSNI